MPPKPPLTHFLCLPLVTSLSRPQLQASLSRFAAEVSQHEANGEPKIPPRALRPVGSIHLTIGVMSLQSSEQIEEACRFLKSLDVGELLRAASAESAKASKPASAYKSSTSSNRPLSSLLLPEDLPPAISAERREPLAVALTNLVPMQSLTSTSSLYASPKPLHPILPFAQRLHDALSSAGFLLPPPSNRPLRLHATLVNTIYVKQSAAGKNRWGKGSGKIDASEIVKKWGGTTWAEGVRVEKVAICEMGAKKVQNEEGRIIDEVYKELATVELP